jgi:hypothetical protein
MLVSVSSLVARLVYDLVDRVDTNTLVRIGLFRISRNFQLGARKRLYTFVHFPFRMDCGRLRGLIPPDQSLVES